MHCNFNYSLFSPKLNDFTPADGATHTATADQFTMVYSYSYNAQCIPHPGSEASSNPTEEPYVCVSERGRVGERERGGREKHCTGVLVSATYRALFEVGG